MVNKQEWREHFIVIEEKDRKPRNETNIVKVYKVTMPTWFMWPGKVTLHISYTLIAAQDFIDAYPNKFITPWLSIEEQEIIAYDTD